MENESVPGALPSCQTTCIASEISKTKYALGIYIPFGHRAEQPLRYFARYGLAFNITVDRFKTYLARLARNLLVAFNLEPFQNELMNLRNRTGAMIRMYLRHSAQLT